MKRYDGLPGRSLGREDTAILVPVRLGGSRFADKALKLLWGKPLFWWAYRAAKLSNVAAYVQVVTDSDRVRQACLDSDTAFLHDPTHSPTGSDRVAAVIDHLWMDREGDSVYPAKVIINLQCDEPQITATDLTVLAQAVWASRSVQVATLATPLLDQFGHGQEDRNTVKVLVDHRDRALYFTRSFMPEQRKSQLAHVGVYAFRRPTLESFGRYPRGNLEQSEGLEQLRLLEEGVPIHVVRIQGERQAVNVERDLEWLEQQESPATT